MYNDKKKLVKVLNYMWDEWNWSPRRCNEVMKSIAEYEAWAPALRRATDEDQYLQYAKDVTKKRTKTTNVMKKVVKMYYADEQWAADWMSMLSKHKPGIMAYDMHSFDGYVWVSNADGYDKNWKHDYQRLGKVMRRKLQLPDHTISEFVQRFKDAYAEYGTRRAYTVDIYHGQDLFNAYQSFGTGPLKSCMTRGTMPLDLYVKNPDKVGLAVVSHKGTPVNRALVWYGDDGQRGTDRIYPTDSRRKNVVHRLLKEKGFYHNCSGINSTLNVAGIAALPYIDGMRYATETGDEDTRVFSNGYDTSTRSKVWQLQTCKGHADLWYGCAQDYTCSVCGDEDDEGTTDITHDNPWEPAWLCRHCSHDAQIQWCHSCCSYEREADRPVIGVSSYYTGCVSQQSKCSYCLDTRFKKKSCGHYHYSEQPTDYGSDKCIGCYYEERLAEFVHGAKHWLDDSHGAYRDQLHDMVKGSYSAYTSLYRESEHLNRDSLALAYIAWMDKKIAEGVFEWQPKNVPEIIIDDPTKQLNDGIAKSLNKLFFGGITEIIAPPSELTYRSLREQELTNATH